MDLYDSSRIGDIVGVFDALSHGANPNWVHMIEGNKTCLHACAVTSGAILGDDEMSETNSINDDMTGAHTPKSQVIHVTPDSPHTYDEKLEEDTNSPIELVLGNSHMQWVECAELLILNGANRDAKDGFHQSPLEAAERAGVNEEMIAYLKIRR